ncbi:tyrosine-type recombinase/integrase [Rhodococcus sp. NPDC057529]|uniref:tyrosine-type recombinase/integrase n=1 Tax=Rhodococcus sp. NPDC057529 TaxID=3346158 RepID=UPI00366DCBA1
MHNWTALIDEYLAFRIARGFQPSRKIERLLSQFVASLPDSRDDEVLFRNADVLTWVNAPDRAAPSWVSARLSIVRGFALYLAGSGLPVVVPACRQAPTSCRRATPYLYSTSEIVDLMDATDVLFTPLRAATMRTLIGLLFVTGMRIGETLHLSIGDLDTEQNTLTIRHAKLGRERIVCLDTSTSEALRAYLDAPPRHDLGTGVDRPLFVTCQGAAVCYSNVCGAFHQMVRRVGLARRAGARPRLHDLRHSFATRTMIDAYRTGRDPGHTFAVLSLWLGHSNPTDTYWYLQAAPEVAAIAAGRLDRDQEW